MDEGKTDEGMNEQIKRWRDRQTDRRTVITSRHGMFILTDCSVSLHRCLKDSSLNIYNKHEIAIK